MVAKIYSNAIVYCSFFNKYAEDRENLTLK